MKKLIVLALSLSLFTACGKKDDAAAPAAAPAADAPAADAPAAAPAAPAAAPAANGELAKLLEGIELNAKGLKTLYTGKSYQEMNTLDLLLLTHDSEVVRNYVYNRATRNHDSNDETLQKLVEQLKGEKNNSVIASGIRSLMNNLKVSDDLYEFVKTSTKNDDVSVRSAAAFALSNVNNKSVPGIFDEAIKLLADPEKDVRKAICKELPRSGNEAIIPEIVKILSSTDDKDLAIHGDCLDGLLSMWYNWPGFESNSEAAYKATMDYLKTTPRSKKIPAWNGLSRLTQDHSKKPAWKEAATYFNAADLVAVMSDIAKEEAADINARKAAVKSIGVFGTKADLEALNGALTDSKDAENVKKEIEKIISKM